MLVFCNVKNNLQTVLCFVAVVVFCCCCWVDLLKFSFFLTSAYQHSYKKAFDSKGGPGEPFLQTGLSRQAGA